jgi:stalled ribosome rescue protein Dom34
MSLLAVWVDREHAKIFRFSANGLTHTNYVSHEPRHHTHDLDQKDHFVFEKHFFKEFTHELLGAEQILILGPGVAKHHFRNYLIEHHPEFAKNIVGCETVDHPTDAQIISEARKYFSTERLA